jgi:hypothetical protein
MDSSVSVSRHERPRAHHELALRSAGGAPAARALALLPLPLRLRPMHSSPCARRAAGRHTGLLVLYAGGTTRPLFISAGRLCWAPFPQPPRPRGGAFSPRMLGGRTSQHPVAAQAGPGVPASSVHGAGCHHFPGGLVSLDGWGSAARRGGRGVSGVGQASLGFRSCLGVPWLDSPPSRPPWTAPASPASPGSDRADLWFQPGRRLTLDRCLRPGDGDRPGAQHVRDTCPASGPD